MRFPSLPPIARGHLQWIALFCLTLGGAGCASRKEPSSEQEAPPARAAPEQKEISAVATKLDCTMSVSPRLKAGEPVELRFQLSNPTARPVFVLDWHTPLEGLLANFLQVTRDGQEVPYQGPMMKRGDPGAEDYVAIQPGASAEAKVEVSLAYDFTQPGHYRLAFRDSLMDVITNQAEVPHPRERFQPLAVQCPAVETTIVTP
jgi:hypothetical protein